MLQRFKDCIRNKYNSIFKRSKCFDIIPVETFSVSRTSVSKDIETLIESLSKQMETLSKQCEIFAKIEHIKLPVIIVGRKKPHTEKQILSFERNFSKHSKLSKIKGKPKKKMVIYDKIFDAK